MLNLKPFDNGVYYVKQELLDTLETIEDVAKLLCQIGNYYGSEIDKTFVWPLAKQVGLDRTDFINDEFELYLKHGKEAVKEYRLFNWKYFAK